MENNILLWYPFTEANNLNMKTHLFLFTIISCSYLFAQTPNDQFLFKNKNSIQADIGGHTVFYGFNYERILLNKNKLKTTVQAGFSIYPEFTNVIPFWFPVSINQLVSFNAHHAEIGLGVMPVIEKVFETPSGPKKWMANLFSICRLGYRYQRPEGRFIFRAGLTPVISTNWRNSGKTFGDIYVLPCLSVGYSF